MEKPLTSLDFKANPLNFGVYWLFFLFHGLYFVCLGPFIYVFFLFTPKMRNLIHNMQILRFTLKSALNILPWISIILIIIIGVQEEWEDEMYKILLYNIAMIHLLKCSILAAKYSTLGYDKMR
jgi:glucose-6-phosphate-specific signal transduction histidine kinase